jgi:hypothetical protein
MFRKKTKIKKLENNFKIVGDSLNRSWEWINHFNDVNSVYEERISRVENTNKQLVDITKQLIKRMEDLETSGVEVVEEVVEEIPRNLPIVSKSFSLPQKDLFLIELLYQYAAFNKENSIETGTLYDNLTYKITKRGLRKKLNSLVDNGILRTIKRGNSRFWYLNPGSLGKIKSALKSKE